MLYTYYVTSVHVLGTIKKDVSENEIKYLIEKYDVFFFNITYWLSCYRDIPVRTVPIQRKIEVFLRSILRLFLSSHWNPSLYQILPISAIATTPHPGHPFMAKYTLFPLFHHREGIWVEFEISDASLFVSSGTGILPIASLCPFLPSYPFPLGTSQCSPCLCRYCT